MNIGLGLGLGSGLGLGLAGTSFKQNEYKVQMLYISVNFSSMIMIKNALER